MVLFSFYVEVFVENACVCIRLMGLRMWLFCPFDCLLCSLYAVRLIIAIVDVKTYLILSCYTIVRAIFSIHGRFFVDCRYRTIKTTSRVR